MNPLRRWADRAAGLLGVFLTRQSGYKPPPPLAYKLASGLRFDLDDPNVVGVFSAGVMPEEVLHEKRVPEVQAIMGRGFVGAVLGQRVVVVHDTGLGYVASRAVVVLKSEP